MIAPRLTICAADLFCGAGGSSTGALAACHDLGYQFDLTAVNHWPVAVETHTANHGTAMHFCEDLGAIDPLKAVPGGHLHLLIASPECTHHSNARGGRPMQDQSRASAWHITRWAAALRIDNILIENVPEFRHWGPLGENGHPLKSKREVTFRAFLQAVRSLGYRVEWRILNAANSGDVTTRKRLFVIARTAPARSTGLSPRTHRRPRRICSAASSGGAPRARSSTGQCQGRASSDAKAALGQHHAPHRRGLEALRRPRAGAVHRHAQRHDRTVDGGVQPLG